MESKELPQSLEDRLRSPPTDAVLIDGDDKIRQAYEAFLNELPFSKVVSLSSEQAALQNISSKRSDLYILDLTIEGGLEGLELIDHIRELYGDKPHIIVTTGRADPQTRTQALKTKADFYLLKPCSIADLARSIELAFNCFSEKAQGSSIDDMKAQINENIDFGLFQNARLLAQRYYERESMGHAMDPKDISYERSEPAQLLVKAIVTQIQQELLYPSEEYFFVDPQKANDYLHVLTPASRHFLIKVGDFAVKIAAKGKSLAAQVSNMNLIESLNNERRRQGFSDDDYINAPKVISGDDRGGISYVVYNYVPGRNLYSYILEGKASEEFFLKAIIEAARLNVEGTFLHPEAEPLIDEEATREGNGYIHRRFRQQLDVLKDGSGIEMTKPQQDLLFSSLWVLEEPFYRMEPLFYYDMGPRNVIMHEERKAFLVDTENEETIPPVLGLISLFEYCGGADSEIDVQSLLKRYYFEVVRSYAVRKVDECSLDDVMAFLNCMDETLEDWRNKTIEFLQVDCKSRAPHIFSDKEWQEFRAQYDMAGSFWHQASAWKNFEWACHKAGFTKRSRMMGNIPEYLVNTVEQIRHLTTAISSLDHLMDVEERSENKTALRNVRHLFRNVKRRISLYDSHTHTRYSDGDEKPEQLLESAVHNGLNAIAITDHDTVQGAERALMIKNALEITYKHNNKVSLPVGKPAAVIVDDNDQFELDYETARAILLDDFWIVPGIELTTIIGGSSDQKGIGAHLLGYGVSKNIEKNRRLVQTQKLRHQRSLKILELYSDAGIDIHPDEIEYQGPFISRWHIAKAVYKRLRTESEQDLIDKGFEKLAGLKPDEFMNAIRKHTAEGGRFSVPYEEAQTGNMRFCETAQGAKLLARYSASVVIAHPGDIYSEYVKRNQPEECTQGNYSGIERHPAAREFLKDLITWLAKDRLCNIKGVEVYSPRHSQPVSDSLAVLVDDINKEEGLDLRKTFGSDYHGKNIRPDIILGIGSTFMADDTINRGLTKKDIERFTGYSP